MKICVFGAASPDIDKIYIDTTYNVCKDLGLAGHSLVFGSGARGLMGAAARGFKDAEQKIVGIVPSFFKESAIEPLFEGCDEVIYTDTMNERKELMLENSDAILSVPGGIGTYDELFEVITSKKLGLHSKPIYLLNIDGFYEPLDNLIESGIEKGFISKETKNLYKLIASASEI